MRTVVQILRAPAGGIRKHVLDIIDNISDENFKQIFITNLNDADINLDYLKNNKNIQVIHLDIKESPGMSDLRNFFKIYRALSKNKIDVLHGHGAKGGLYARILSKILRARCIYTPHGGSLHRVHGRIKNVVYDLIERFLMPMTDIFLFESNYSAEVFTKNITDPGKKTVINYNGVDIPEKYSTNVYQAGDKIRFASFGLLRHLKGHDIFIHTCRMLKEKKIPFSYTIYGNGEFGLELNELIQKFNLSEEVKIVNYSGNVCLEMLKFDFIVHPSRFESFGYVPVEAMSVKVPVIVSHEGGLKEVVDESSGYINYDNSADKYMSIVEKLYKGDPDLPQKITEGYKRVINKFSKQAMLNKIRALYL